MAKKEIAPTCCPKCGEEKLWSAETDPDVSVYKMIAYGLSRLFLGGHLSSIVANSIKAKMVYRCGKCGFTGKYTED